MMLKEGGLSSTVAEKKFFDTFLTFVNNLNNYELPIIVTNISEKKQLESCFYCLVVSENNLVLTKRFPGKKVLYSLNLDTFELESSEFIDKKQSYSGFVVSLRQILMDIKSREARILRKV
jgi:hypothetical protein